MSHSCPQLISTLQKIQSQQAQLQAQLADLSNYQALERDEKVTKLNSLLKLRSKISKIINEVRMVNLEQAEKAIGQENFFGPKEIKKAFNFKHDIDPKLIPEVGFTLEELERAKKLNHFLVLRIKEVPGSDGAPLTMKKIMELKENKTADGGKLLSYDAAVSWYKGEAFFTSEPLSLSWALVTREVVVKETDNKNYLEQYDILIDYLINEVFKNQSLPEEYQEAINDFNLLKEDVKFQAQFVSEIAAEWQAAIKKLEELKITKLLRRTPVEILYDLVVTADGKKPNGQKLLTDTYDWSSRCYSGGMPVGVGSFGAGGADAYAGDPADATGHMSACLSRTSS